MPKKSVLQIHIENAEDAVKTAETFILLAEKHPERKKELLKAAALCKIQAQTQIVMARLYKQ
jgi:hypothetical protein